MTASKPNSGPKRLGSGLLLSLAALLASLGALAPAASADFDFEPGAYAKAHPPLNQSVPPAICEQFQCSFVTEDGEQAWVQPIADAPELTQAGAHPDFTVHFRFENAGFPGNDPSSGAGDGRARTVVSDAPAGSVGNPLAVPRCEGADFHLSIYGACPKESQVGVSLSDSCCFFGGSAVFLSPVSVLVPPPGKPALLGFKSFAYTVILIAEVRSESDYGLRINAAVPIPVFVNVLGNTVTLWGVPHDPVHNSHRVNDLGLIGGSGSAVAGVPRPFLSAPTNCSTGPLDFTLRARTWEDPDRWVETVSTAPEQTGCDQIAFAPSLSAVPTTNAADSPTGLEVDVHTPQNNESCEPIGPPFPGPNDPQYDCGLATSHLKDTVVTLPEGLAINPSGANGLDGCSPQEVGLTTPVGVSPQQFTKDPPTCPDASAVASVEIDTPLLNAPMPGRVYIADPYQNPFGSLIALYIVADDPERGVIVKLAGEVTADPETGQLTTRVENAPQLPFEHFKLSFKTGPHSQLTTPVLCGTHTTDSQLTPYADPANPVAVKDAFSITQGCAQSEAELPHSPGFSAGAVIPIAGEHSPFVVRLRREDGSQRFRSVSISPPPGFTAKLAGTPYCPEAALAAAQAKDGRAEQASPSCPAASRVGSVQTAAGSGPDPYNAPGKVYLAGPYKGAPLSLVTVIPAVAGPFDLGTVLTRVALRIDPVTAKITAASDEIPAVIDGIPLNVRRVDVLLDKPEFSKNPTSCDETAVEGSVLSTLGALANLSERFQLGECRRLGFKPRLFLRLYGKRFRRGSNPRLRAVLVPREGEANIAFAQVRMPHSLFLDQSHIRTVCTRAQFATDTCPKGSIYGKAAARTPLLDAPLRGNVYLRSSDNPLPDLVADLRGQVRIEAIGRTDSVKGALRNTFDIVPDAPVGKFVMFLQGGKKSLLVASRHLCKGAQRALVTMRAHNGRISRVRQPIAIAKCSKLRRRAKRRAERRKHRRAARRASISAARRSG